MGHIMNFKKNDNNIPINLNIGAIMENEVNNDNNAHLAVSEVKKINNSNKKKTNFIWMDPEIENEKNIYHYNIIFKNNNIDCLKFDNIDDGYNYLLEKQNEFKEFNIIISLKFFNDFYSKIRENINNIKYAPTIIIFTSDEKRCLNHLRMNNIYNNNDIFNTKFIFTLQSQIENFINNNIEQEDDLTFDIIDYLEQLIVPNYYYYLLENVNEPEIYYFNSFIRKTFLPPENKEEIEEKISSGKIPLDLKMLNKLSNSNIQELLDQIENKKLPKQIILKYWLRMYSIQSEFFNELNSSLRKKDKNMYFYYPLIKLCYEGVKKGFIKPYYNKIYRCSKIK